MSTEQSTRRTSTLDQVTATVAAEGLRLGRTWPRDEHHLLLELFAGQTLVAGQWFASPSRAAEVAGRTPGARCLGHVVLQPDGADRRLPGLAALLDRDDAELVAHRPERRAVVRLAGAMGGQPSAYAKVVRPSALPAVARTTEVGAGLGLRTPQLLWVWPAEGVVGTSPLPGRTLHDLLGTPAALPAARAAGRALAQLHRSPIPAGLARHDHAQEAAVIERWQRLAREHGLRPAFDVQPAPAAPAAPPASTGTLIHRDFHDKQVVVDEAGEVGLLDFDLMAVGPPTLDLANLLAHLDLRARQGLLADSGPLRAAVLDGYRPTSEQLAQLPHHEHCTWLRLAAVYAFRPAGLVS